MTEKLLQSEKKLKMKCSRYIYEVMKRILKGKDKISQDKEHLWLMLLDSSLQVKSLELISIGTMNGVLWDPCEIFSAAFKKRSASFVLVHNHPSGVLTPSAKDIDSTDQIIQLCKMHQFRLIDKLIISTEGYLSFKDTGLFEELKGSLKYVPQFSFWERVQDILKHERYLNKAVGLIK